MPETLINAQDLNTYYGASHILRGVNFTVGRGETIGLMGRNGMGKSTLLKSIMGIVPPRTGTVDIKGQRMNGRPTFEVAQMGIAYVPEGRGIFGNLSVVENLQMAARPGTRGQRDWTYERVLETFPRLQERLGHGGQQLSGGEQQMLTIGRALMTNPDVLILDEATEGLAPLIAREIWRICSLIKDSGISAIIVDKNWKHVTQITDRNVILVKGQVVFEGSSQALHDDPSVLEQHLGVRLLDRSQRQVWPTEDGERLLGYARRLLRLDEEARQAFSPVQAQRALRLGVPEDLAGEVLTEPLSRFIGERPHVRLEVESGLSSPLLRLYRDGELDLLLVKQWGAERDCHARWSEPLSWVCSTALTRVVEPVPLVVFPVGALYRQEMINALEAAGRSWRISYASTSLTSKGGISEQIRVRNLNSKRVVKARVTGPGQVEVAM